VFEVKFIHQTELFMEKKLNILIIADNVLLCRGLKHDLDSEFGRFVAVSPVCGLRDLNRHLDECVDAVVVDHQVDGVAASHIARQVVLLNDFTRVIPFDSSSQVLQSVSAMLNLSEFVRKTEKQLI
jgi:hypothetical protein